MSSPTSAKMEELISSISAKVDVPEIVQERTSAPVQSAGMKFSISEKVSPYISMYQNHLIAIYIISTLIGAYVFAQSREEDTKSSTDNKKKRPSTMKVLVWFIVFNIPLIIWKAVSIRKE